MRFGPTRTILNALDRGPNRRSYNNQITSDELGDHPVLYWSGDVQPVTIVGSTSEIADGVGSANLSEWTAVLRYQSGGFSRSEEWSWQPQGWSRTLLAAQVEIIARRVDGSAAPRAPMTMGASLVQGAWQSDSLNFVLRTPTVAGSVPITQRVPVGMREFRGWQVANQGALQTGFVTVDGTFSAFFTFSWADLADWRPWPNLCNAVQLNNGGVAAACVVETRA